jgi:hypothetical protein
VAEGYVLVGVLAADIELVRVLEDTFVPVGRGQKQHEPRAFGDLNTGYLDRTGRRSAPGDHRGVTPQSLFDGVLDQGGILSQLVPQLWPCEQLPEAVKDQVHRGFVAGEGEAVADAYHLLEAQVVLVFCPDPQQVAGVVLTEVFRPPMDKAFYVVEEGCHLLDGCQLFLGQRAPPGDLQAIRAPALEHLGVFLRVAD